MNIFKTLLKWKEHFEEIAGNWNGDESGLAEDNATHALEVLEHINGLLELIEEE